MKTEVEYKTQFAYELLKANIPPNDTINAFKVALEMFPGDTALALQVSQEWTRDSFVKAERERFADELGDLAFLPSKADLARAIWDKANATTGYICTEDFTKLMRLYAEVRGFIEKPGLNVQTNVNVNNRVMVITDHGTDEEWALKVKSQQARLISDNA
jgi:hypothetical protein